MKKTGKASVVSSATKQEYLPQIESWPIEKIKPFPENAKMHKVSRIAESIKQFKPDVPIVVDEAGVIIKGHGRYEAAIALGMKTFPVIVRVDLSPEQARLARIADNRAGEAGWDWEKLQREMESLSVDLPNGIDLAELGITDDWWKKGSFDFSTSSAPAKAENATEKKADKKGQIEPAAAQGCLIVITLSAQEDCDWRKYKESIGSIDDRKAFLHMLENSVAVKDESK